MCLYIETGRLDFETHFLETAIYRTYDCRSQAGYLGVRCRRRSDREVGRPILHGLAGTHGRAVKACSWCFALGRDVFQNMCLVSEKECPEMETQILENGKRRTP